MSEDDLYADRGQTQIKHFILRKYLERFAHIIGSHWDTITYVDCFSGPWNAQSEDLKDTSFAIALEELRKARATYETRGKSLQLRCMFLEKDAAAYVKLKEFSDKVSGIQIQTRNSELAGAVKEILPFIRQGGQSSFPFIFIDPTGWTGFAMDLIAPLLRQRPGEVLINFMTDYIRRFIDHPDQQTQQHFAALFGSADFKARLKGLEEHQDREDVLLGAYSENVRKTGGFTHSCTAIVLYPEIDRSYFHLIYATRHREGVKVFKNVERKAMEVMEQTRAEAKQRKRVKRSRQPELFSGQEMPHSRPIDALRTRYLAQAKQRVSELLQAKRRVPYESAWDLALSFPLVWESDLKEWVKEWKLRIEGAKPRQKGPKLEENNVLVWERTSS